MKIVRDPKGKIIQIVKEESDGDDVNITEIFKAEVDADKEITIAKMKERKEIWTKAIITAPSMIESFGCYNDPNFSIQEPPPMPPYDDQLDQCTDPNS